METLLIVVLVAGVAWLTMRGSVARRRAEADETASGWSTLRWLPAFLFIGAITHGAPGTDASAAQHGDSWGGPGDVGGFGGGGGE